MLRGFWRFTGVLGLGLLTQSCSLFEKDVYVIADVPEIENAFEMNVLWHTSVGSGVGKFFSSLSPAVSGRPGSEHGGPDLGDRSGRRGGERQPPQPPDLRRGLPGL